MSDQIKRFIECLIPVTACNIKCSYCYVVQRDYRNMKMPEMKYSLDTISKALSKERWGGTCYFSICGAGETLMPHETIDIAYELLKQGHFVNITTNGTLSKRFDEILKFPIKYLEKMHFAFSLHYIELKRINKLEEFFQNIKRIKAAGCSFTLQTNLCDEYIPYLDEIKKRCLEEMGALPQVAATRKEQNLKNRVRLMTELSDDEYIKLGNNFESPLFDFTMKNFNVHRNEFCYAGDWTTVLNLATGIMSRCYGSHFSQDIFAHPEEPIKFQAMGNCCQSLFCMNSSHFLSLGAIPDLDTPTYAELRNRKKANWYSPRMEAFLNQKLCDNNNTYGKKELKMSRKLANREKIYNAYQNGKHMIKNTIKMVIKRKKA